MAINVSGVATTDFTKHVENETLGKAPVVQSHSGASKAVAEDTTSFTSDTQTIQSLSKVALQTIPSRQVKVESLRQAVNSAQYQLDAAKIAQSLANSDV